jgi:hypothetical protein
LTQAQTLGPIAAHAANHFFDRSNNQLNRETADQVSSAFEGFGWNYIDELTGSDHSVRLAVSELTGDQVLALFGALCPNGVPIPGITVSLSSNGLVVK